MRTDPGIIADLGAGTPKAICGVDISWADSTQYRFTISVSLDGSTYTPVFSAERTDINSSPQKYIFEESEVRYVKITITQSHAGSASSIAQIAEIDILGNTQTGSLGANSQTSVEEARTPSINASTAKSETPQTSVEDAEGSSINASTANSPVTPDEALDISQNKQPDARNDIIRTQSNNPVLVPILSNDIDPDDDKLELVYIASSTKNHGIVTVNGNGTITYSPATNFAGADAFSYTVTDGKGKLDTARVTIVVEEVADSKTDQTNEELMASRQRQATEQQNKGDIQEENLTEINQANDTDASRS